MSGLSDAEWDDLRSENMYDTEEGVRRYVDRILADRMAEAWDKGWTQGASDVESTAGRRTTSARDRTRPTPTDARD